MPVCPRHTDRVSYVRCQRCGRPVCPECQRPAAVGVQCVDCVREGAKSIRQGRTIFGGDVAAIGGRPVVTMTIIGICVAVFLGQLAMPNLTNDVAFAPYLGDKEPWRFLTSAFAHAPGNFLHIGFNMYALWIMGGYLEPMLGRARFAALYLITAFGGSVVYLLLAFPSQVPGEYGSWETGAVGASGAVFGLFGAFIILQRRLGRSAATMYATIGINAVIGFVVPGIAWQAHLGGFLVGIACAAVFAYLGKRPEVGGTQRASFTIHWIALAGITVLLVVLAVAKYALTTVPY